MKPGMRGHRRHQAVPGAQLVLRARRRLRLPGRLRPRPRAAGCSSASSSSRRSATATATATRTTSTSARTTPRTSTTSRTRTAAPSPTTTSDGILDVDDKCPQRSRGPATAFEDEDGCPDRHRRTTATATASSTTCDKCPDDPEDKDGFEDEDGCPDPDNDKDGILDVDDLCPNDPEDKDGFEDKDGCPDPDNDKDRILDVDDKCPNEPETYNGVEDEDGCPDKGRVIVERGQDRDPRQDLLRDRQGRHQADLASRSSTPSRRPSRATRSSQLIEIQGHADERGNDDYNLDLTDGRARVGARRRWSERGVETGAAARARLRRAASPSAPGHNENCWSQNRRVEFIIIKRSDEVQLQGGEGQ